MDYDISLLAIVQFSYFKAEALSRASKKQNSPLAIVKFSNVKAHALSRALKFEYLTIESGNIS